METKQVEHVNKISGWDNAKQRELFCKREHKLVSASIDKCEKCPYFKSAGQGDVIICVWEDRPPAAGITRVIPHSEIRDEFLRVSALIDEGIVQKG